ncbi:MAG: type fimbrial biosis protein FimT [Thauera sp.]|jgi:type IV fimbrial biogenesis protein FimT|nr:GspH/FimT family pseudopilin [Thauera sp.]MDI3491376.1 type fimbrial biosis protein FimT [Thauera sp.]
MTKSRNRGFTLIELMMAIAILGIIAAIAAPSFIQTIRNNRLTATANEVLLALQLARAEAIKQRRNLTVCAGQTACTGSADWSGGWIVTNGDEVIRIWEARPSLTVTGPAGGLTFSPDGRGGGTEAITVASGDSSRTVTVTPTGRASVGH